MNKISLFAKISIFSVVFWLLSFALLPNLLVVISSFLTKGDSEFLIFIGSFESYIKLFDPQYLSNSDSCPNPSLTILLTISPQDISP